MIWYIKQSVTARVARVTFGMSELVEYDPHDPEHRAREQFKVTKAEWVFSCYPLSTSYRTSKQAGSTYVAGLGC